VAADSAYGDQDGFRAELSEAGLPLVMALKPRRGTWAYGDDAHTPVDAARELAWGGPEDPGDWTAVTRSFRGGHAETWQAADARLGWWGPDEARRLVVATADPGTLPAKATCYLVTNLPGRAARARPAARTRPRTWPRSPGSTASGTGSSRGTSKDELGWADFQVRSDLAIHRHQVLVNCAFSFCWDAWFAHPASGGPHGPRRPRPRGCKP
jgi:DDE superfamily endonuclease